jgi:hypothetical protein
MKYQQKHPETCLAKCLMILIEKLKNIKIGDEYELDLLIFSLKYERENIARGHLEKVVKDFEVKIDWVADSKIFYDFVNKMQIPKEISLLNQKINLFLIDKLLKNPLIVYTDRFNLWKEGDDLYYKYHYPHFVIITQKKGENYEVIDPDDGKVKIIDAKSLGDAINSLRNYLWISPQIIQVKN